jgi:ferric-dicitrate binding protein FerR (iron transport regulator)
MEERIYRLLQGDIDEVEARQVDVWRRASPQNEAVFRQIERLYNSRQLLTPALYQSTPPAARDFLRTARRSGRWVWPVLRVRHPAG